MIAAAFLLLTALAQASDAKPPAASVVPAKAKSADAHCVKDQLQQVQAFEKTYYAAHQVYTSSLQDAGVPKSLIDLCAGWSDPVAKTTYGGAGVEVRSEHPVSGEAYSLNQDGRFVQESISKVSPAAF
jgi:hypothetical protein